VISGDDLSKELKYSLLMPHNGSKEHNGIEFNIRDFIESCFMDKRASLKYILNICKKEIINLAIEKSGGSIIDAAKLLKVHRNTISRRTK